jgi:hypothetical protein
MNQKPNPKLATAQAVQAVMEKALLLADAAARRAHTAKVEFKLAKKSGSWREKPPNAPPKKPAAPGKKWPGLPHCSSNRSGRPPPTDRSDHVGYKGKPARSSRPRLTGGGADINRLMVVEPASKGSDGCSQMCESNSTGAFSRSPRYSAIEMCSLPRRHASSVGEPRRATASDPRV